LILWLTAAAVATAVVAAVAIDCHGDNDCQEGYEPEGRHAERFPVETYDFPGLTIVDHDVGGLVDWDGLFG
jgi:hypothetical protein